MKKTRSILLNYLKNRTAIGENSNFLVFNKKRRKNLLSGQAEFRLNNQKMVSLMPFKIIRRR